jgi:hypothetical protein
MVTRFFASIACRNSPVNIGCSIWGASIGKSWSNEPLYSITPHFYPPDAISVNEIRSRTNNFACRNPKFLFHSNAQQLKTQSGTGVPHQFDASVDLVCPAGPQTGAGAPFPLSMAELSTEQGFKDH